MVIIALLASSISAEKRKAKAGPGCLLSGVPVLHP
jgi:hypothetical protein